MASLTVYIACAEGEERLAEQLADPLREAGYSVSHQGTILVGSSNLAEAAKALAAGAPVVLCATVRAIGSKWAHQIVNSGHKTSSVFVVQMESEAYVDQVALQTKVARYCDNPAGAIKDLLDALKSKFPVERNEISAPTLTDPVISRGYLDEPAPSATLDIEALQDFRRELRPEVVTQYPGALTAWEFLDRANLRVGDWLTRTGALLFARNPPAACPTAMIKCVCYQGTTRDSRRVALITYEGTVPAQIEAARLFIARHVQHDEAPTADSPRAEAVYAYPMIAVREILANALTHREYASQDSCVHVRLYADRLEISSPGAWFGKVLEPGAEHGLAELDGQSIKRNYRLAHLLSWILMVEGEGSGIPTAVKDCDLSRAPRPTVLQDQGFVTVTLFPNPAPEEVFVEGYRRQLISAHGFIEPPDFERRTRSPLEDLYVSPHFTHVINETSTMTASLDEVRASANHAVILGDPGSGKTTAAKAIVVRTARETGGPLPFLVNVRQLAQGGYLQRSVLEYIEDHVSNYYQVQLVPGLVERYLTDGDAMVMFDGLDELIDTSQRRDVTRILELFATRYPKAHIIVTSRRIGYGEAPLDPLTFEVFRLSKFSNDEVSEYVRKWFGRDQRAAGEGEVMAATFLSESASVPDLRTNPLMLSLMCIIYRGQNFLPRNRPHIYELCAEMLFSKWDASRQIGVPLQVHSLVDPLIKHLAYWMLTSEVDGAGGLPRSAVVREVISYLSDHAFDDIHLASAAADEFVEFCRGRAWVFTDVGSTADGEPLYAFTHRAFLEYFAAYQLVRRCGSAEKLVEILLPRIINGEWEVVAQLSIQIVDNMIESGADRAFETMLESESLQSYETRANILGFLARCLTFIRVNRTLVSRITDESELLNIADRN